MNKNMVKLMAATVATTGIVAPFSSVVANAAEKEFETVDVTIANEDSVEFNKLAKIKQRLASLKEAKYTTTDVDGKEIEQRKYRFEDIERQNLESSAYQPSIAITENLKEKGIYKLVVRDVQTGIVELAVEFVGIPKLDSDFGQGESGIEIRDYFIDMSKTDAKSQVEDLKKAIKEKELSYQVRVEAVNTNDQRATYKVTLAMPTSSFHCGTVYISNAPLSWVGEDNQVILPSNSDFQNHWAKKEIEDAMTNKWIDTTNTFRPEDQITRAEFVKIVNNAFDIKDIASQTNKFDDIDGTEWYANEVAKAVKYGYIKGYETTVTDKTTGEQTIVTEFRPNQPISRQEATVIIARMFGVNETNKDVVTKFVDDKEIANWADESVVYLNDRGVINGYGDNTFRPNNQILRAEAVKLIAGAVK